MRRRARLWLTASFITLNSAAAQAQIKITPDRDLLSAEDLAIRKKLQPFIHCMNNVTHNLALMVRPYHELYAKFSKNPEAATSENVFFWKQYQYSGALFGDGAEAKTCASGLDASTKLPPADQALDDLAVKFAADLRTLDALAPKVETYYDNHDYRDDKMAHGRAMNAEYDPLLQRLVLETHTMFTEVGNRNIVAEHHRVDAIEAHDGRHLRWEANAFMFQARSTLRAMIAIVASKAVTKDAVLAQVTPLEERYSEAKAYAVAHPEEDNNDMDLWSRISGDRDDFMLAAKEARRDATDKPALQTLSDHVERMNYEFDNMVGSANASQR